LSPRSLPGGPVIVIVGEEAAVEQIHEPVAGLDVHRDSVAASFRQAGPRGGVGREKERFTTTTAGLEVLGGWLGDRQVQLVAIEATGVDWKPVYYALESRFTVWLCNARHVKKVPGRKTDLSDADWLADVAAHGMVRPSFVPPPQIRELRELTRYRKTQIDARVAEVQRLEKILQDAGVKLTSVASKVLTQSGRSMIEALIAGERTRRDWQHWLRASCDRRSRRSPKRWQDTWAAITPSPPDASWRTWTSWRPRSPISPNKSTPALRPSAPSTGCCSPCPALTVSPST
jgi:transposase